MINYSSEVDPVFHALADPTRRLIVERLSRGPASVSELARPLERSLPAIVQHLAILESVGLVRTSKTGRVRTCALDPEPMMRAERWFQERRATWERRLDRLGEYLAANAESDTLNPDDPEQTP